MARTLGMPVNRSGWVPIRLIRQGGEGWVDWCWLGDARFTEPFFDLTIEAAQRRPFNTLFTHRTPLGELGRWYDESPGMAPAGFIFHMSRCGSTLISQMLAALPDNVVVSEAAPLDRIARADWLPEATRAPGLRWMVSALGQRRLGCETRYFIKFDSATAVALPFLRRVFPDVPWTFVIRDPEEVLISHLRDPAAAMSPGMITDVNLVGVPPHEARSLSPEEYAARAIGRLCDCAVAGMDERGLVVNYTELFCGAEWRGTSGLSSRRRSGRAWKKWPVSTPSGPGRSSGRTGKASVWKFRIRCGRQRSDGSGRGIGNWSGSVRESGSAFEEHAVAGFPELAAHYR